MALNTLFCADMPLRNYSLTGSLVVAGSRLWIVTKRCIVGLYFLLNNNSRKLSSRKSVILFQLPSMTRTWSGPHFWNPLLSPKWIERGSSNSVCAACCQFGNSHLSLEWVKPDTSNLPRRLFAYKVTALNSMSPLAHESLNPRDHSRDTPRGGLWIIYQKRKPDSEYSSNEQSNRPQFRRPMSLRSLNPQDQTVNVLQMNRVTVLNSTSPPAHESEVLEPTGPNSECSSNEQSNLPPFHESAGPWVINHKPNKFR